MWRVTRNVRVTLNYPPLVPKEQLSGRRPDQVCSQCFGVAFYAKIAPAAAFVPKAFAPSQPPGAPTGYGTASSLAASQPLAGPSGQADAPARLGALETCPRALNQLGCCAPGTVLAQPTTNIREGAQAPSLHAQHSHLRWHHQPCAREPRLVQHTADVTMGARPSHRWWQGGALSSESAMRSQNGQTF